MKKVSILFGFSVLIVGLIFIFKNQSNNVKNDISIFENEINDIQISEHTCILLEDGSTYGYGNNMYGQLATVQNTIFQIGATHKNSISVPIFLSGSIKYMAVGQWHTLLMDYDNNVYACGNNRYGQIFNCELSPLSPIEYSEETIKLIRLDFDNKVEKIFANWMSSGIIDSEGKLFLWGNNEYGQLGDGTKGDLSEETRDNIISAPIYISDSIKDVAFGKNHTLFLKDNGDLYACGDNRYCQLGIDEIEECLIPKKIMENIKKIDAGLYTSYALDNQGNLWAWGNNISRQVIDTEDRFINLPICIAKDIEDIAAGYAHLVVLAKNVDCWVIGSKEWKQASEYTQTSPLKKIKKIYSGGNTIFVEKENGSLWAWGSNSCHQIDSSDKKKLKKAIRIN